MAGYSSNEGLTDKVKEAYEKLPSGGKSVAKGIGVAAIGGVAGMLLPVLTFGSGFILVGLGYAGYKVYKAITKE